MLNARDNGRWMSLMVALVAFGLAGCSDDDPVGPGPLPAGDFDPVATAQALDGLEQTVSDDNDYLMALQLTGTAISAEGGLSVATDYAAAGLTGWTDPTMVRSFVLSGGSAAPIFPANLLAKTFTWSEDLGRYELSEETGAPANGVRFVVYAMNPLTHTPALPLNPVGHLDLTDESSPESTRLGIEAVSDGVTLIDYYIDAAFTLGSEEYAVILHAIGFLSDGTDRVDFDLAQEATANVSTQVLTMDVLYTVTGSNGMSVVMQLDGEFGEGGPTNAATGFTVTDGVNTALFSLTITDGENISGSLSYNGEVIVNISGTFDEAVFTNAGGGDLTEEELAALQEMLDVAGDVFEFAAEILGGFEAGV